MQYFKPEGAFFVGDCMPFFHDGTFHLYYLLDEDHHRGKNGLGGHQWAHASSTDLVHWTHHPLALTIEEDWECSICTGSVFFHDSTYYAFYATRKDDGSEHLSLAVSTDAVHFRKTLPNPFASPPPGYKRDFRDPVVFRGGDGTFHLLVSAARADTRLPQTSGCLAHLTSPDLKTWHPAEPFLTPGYGGVPECPDHFEWNGWHYLVFSNGGIARYRMSRHPEGPWLRPRLDTFDSDMARVMKTAAFGPDRRLGVAFLPVREGDKNDGALLYGGNALFREVFQHPSGKLGTRFVPEMVPATGEPLPLTFQALSARMEAGEDRVTLIADESFGAASLHHLPLDVRITCRAQISHGGASSFGLLLRATDGYQGCELRVRPDAGRVELGSQFIESVDGLDERFGLDIVLRGDIIDVCVDHRRCLVQRCPQSRGDLLYFFCHNGTVIFDQIEVRLLL